MVLQNASNAATYLAAHGPNLRNLALKGCEMGSILDSLPLAAPALKSLRLDGWTDLDVGCLSSSIKSWMIPDLWLDNIYCSQWEGWFEATTICTLIAERLALCTH